tara:strand:+ start:652 stop:1596 length:945 start_codon:yes stop_codon:yes gene_type:complete
MRKLLLVFIIFFGCKESTTNLLTSSSGNLNEISVALSDELWKGPVGNTLKESFSKPIYGLPQREPMFSLRHIPIRVFSGFVTKNRTIIKVQKAKKTQTLVQYNKYATPQLVIQFFGPNTKEIIKLIKKDSDSMVSLINKLEINEKQRRIKKSLSKSSDLKTNFKIDLKYPSVYRVAKSKNDFIWLRKDTNSGSLNLMVYDDSSKDQLDNNYINIRDSISRLHIPGPVDKTSMSVDNGYIVKSIEGVINNIHYKEYRGMWEVTDQFMAGPFIGYEFEDTKNQRKIYIDGFVYAPSVKKRSYVFELESIIKSIIIN